MARRFVVARLEARFVPGEQLRPAREESLMGKQADTRSTSLLHKTRGSLVFWSCSPALSRPTPAGRLGPGADLTKGLGDDFLSDALLAVLGLALPPHSYWCDSREDFQCSRPSSWCFDRGSRNLWLRGLSLCARESEAVSSPRDPRRLWSG